MSERKSKQIQIPQKPRGAEQWVAQGGDKLARARTEKMKRLTLDLPEGLHRAIKRRSVDEGVTMVDMLRTLLEEHYGSG